MRLFKQSATGLTDGQPKREKVWVPFCLVCLACMSKIVAPWTGQEGEFPESFNQIGIHTDDDGLIFCSARLGNAEGDFHSRVHCHGTILQCIRKNER